MMDTTAKIAPYYNKIVKMNSLSYPQLFVLGSQLEAKVCIWAEIS